MEITFKIAKFTILLPFVICSIPVLLVLNDNFDGFKKDVKGFLWS